MSSDGAHYNGDLESEASTPNQEFKWTRHVIPSRIYAPVCSVTSRAKAAPVRNRSSKAKAAPVLSRSSKEMGAQEPIHSSKVKAAQGLSHLPSTQSRCRYRQKLFSDPSRRQE